MTTGILTLNFGEPSDPSLESVTPFLERIFHANADLEDHATEEERRRRTRELAERRAPALVAEYEEIGGSPLNAQADAQARALEEVLRGRGRDVRVYSAFQFTDPLVRDVAARAREDGVGRLFGLPIYPLCGPSTTVAALNDLEAAVGEMGWDVPWEGVTGWHRHPGYVELRAEAVRRTLREAGIRLGDPSVRLVFSAHGTPRKYLDAGSRYVEYVEEFCAELAERLAAPDFVIGYQNHANRRIEWTQPDIETVIAEIAAEAVVVDAVSFMHEQSETLAELDHELRETAESRGLAFHRVGIPHDDPRFAEVLADLVEPFLHDTRHRAGGVRLARCRCRPRPGTYCLNALPREAPSSSGDS